VTILKIAVVWLLVGLVLGVLLGKLLKWLDRDVVKCAHCGHTLRLHSLSFHGCSACPCAEWEAPRD
jgi:hypothetical protein